MKYTSNTQKMTLSNNNSCKTSPELKAFDKFTESNERLLVEIEIFSNNIGIYTQSLRDTQFNKDQMRFNIVNNLANQFTLF